MSSSARLRALDSPLVRPDPPQQSVTSIPQVQLLLGLATAILAGMCVVVMLIVGLGI